MALTRLLSVIAVAIAALLAFLALLVSANSSYQLAPVCVSGGGSSASCCCAARALKPATVSIRKTKTTTVKGTVTVVKKTTVGTATRTTTSTKTAKRLLARQAEPADVLGNIDALLDLDAPADLSRRHLCPICPANSGVVSPYGKNNGGAAVTLCCPRRKTTTKTKFVTTTKKTGKVTAYKTSSVTAIKTITAVVQTLSGRLYIDNNGDGVYTAGVDTPIGNTPIVVFSNVPSRKRAQPEVIGNTTTKADGTYSVASVVLTPGLKVGIAYANDTSKIVQTGTVGNDGVVQELTEPVNPPTTTTKAAAATTTVKPTTTAVPLALLPAGLIGGTAEDAITSIVRLSASGLFVVGGYFQSPSITVDGTTYNKDPSASDKGSCFVAVFNSTARISSFNKFGSSSGDCRVKGLQEDATAGAVRVVGEFSAAMTVGSASCAAAGGGYDIFALTLTASTGSFGSNCQTAGGSGDEKINGLTPLNTGGSTSMFMACGSTTSASLTIGSSSWTGAGAADAVLFFLQSGDANGWTAVTGTGNTGTEEFLGCDAGGGGTPAGSSTWYAAGYTNSAALTVPGYLLGLNSATTDLATNGGEDGFLVKLKYLANGTFEWSWAQIVGATGDERLTGVARDSNNDATYASGTFTSSQLNFTYQANRIDNLTNAGGQDAFFAKYNDATGSPVWAECLCGNGKDDATAIQIGYLGDYYPIVLGATASSNIGGSNTGVGTGSTMAFLAVGNLNGGVAGEWTIGAGANGQQVLPQAFAHVPGTGTAGTAYVAGKADGGNLSPAGTATGFGGFDGFVASIAVNV